MSVTIMDEVLDTRAKTDPDVKALYQFLGVERYTATFKMPDRKKHDVVLVMRSIGKDSIGRTDTLLNTVPWRQMVVGGFPWDPSSGVEFMAQRQDSINFRISGTVGMGFTKDLVLPSRSSYGLADGPGSNGKPVKVELSKPFTLLVLTQPYPDPPPPEKAVIYRYCFGSEVPPDQWPTTYGVPHLYVFELTVLP
jgi:hypothetical protein